MFRHATKNYPWAAGGSCILSEMGTLQLEMDYLSHVSGDPVFAAKVDKINNHLRSIAPSSNLYSNFINANTGKWGTCTTVTDYDYLEIAILHRFKIKDQQLAHFFILKVFLFKTLFIERDFVLRFAKLFQYS